MQKLRASEIHAGEGIRVIAIESVCFEVQKFAPVYRGFARIEPTAMVVCTVDDNRVIDLALAETSLEELKREVPGLCDMMTAPGR